MASIRAAVLLLGFILASLTIYLCLAPIRKIGWSFGHRLPRYYHLVVTRLWGIRFRQIGQVARSRPVLIVANHTSWLDIPVISTICDLSMISKAEVKNWPVFGPFGKLQRTIFVDRTARMRTADHRDEIHSRLAEGDVLVLFPEGTSSDGHQVLPFKSALLSVAEQDFSEDSGVDELLIQPLSVTYTGLYGLPLERRLKPFCSWYADMELPSHMWEFLKLGPIDVTLELHEPVTLAAFGNRKALTAHCQKVVAEGVATALAGRLTDDKVTAPQVHAAPALA